MDTDHFIRMLAADNPWQSRSVSGWLAMGLIIAGVASSSVFMMTLHVRPDFMAAMRNPFFGLKFMVTLALAIPAIAISLRLARPAAPLGGRIWLLGLPVLLLALGVIGDLLVPQRVSWTTRLIGNSSRACLLAIPSLALPLLVASLIALRHGATVRPGLTGACAGLLSAGLAATLYASHCMDDSPLFVATWYTIATALVTALGAWLGSKVLRF